MNRFIVATLLGPLSVTATTALGQTTGPADVAVQGQLSVEDPVGLRDTIGQKVTGNTERDKFYSAVIVPSQSTARQVDAVSGYIRNDFAGGNGQNGNGVAGFFMAVSNADESQVWGQNLIIVDHPDAQNRHTDLRRTLIGSEFDFANTSEDTEIAGIGLTGSSLVQPRYATGFTVGTLSSQHPGLARWNIAFASVDGAIRPGGSAISIGKLNISNPSNHVVNPSQALSWSYDNSDGATANYRTAVAENGNLLFTGTSADRVYNFDHLLYSDGPIVSNKYMRTTPVTFATLISTVDGTPQIGDRAYITDATVCNFNAGVAGGGTFKCPVVFSGTWVAG